MNLNNKRKCVAEYDHTSFLLILILEMRNTRSRAVRIPSHINGRDRVITSLLLTHHLVYSLSDPKTSHH